MLVLGRSAGESIEVGDNIKITVIAIRGKEARIGIEAPKSVPVRRSEIEPQLATGHDWTWATLKMCDGDWVARKCDPTRWLSRGKSGVMAESFLVDRERIEREFRLNKHDCGATDWEIADVE